MTRALIVGAAALVLSAGAASAQVYVSPEAAPLYDYAAPAAAGMNVPFDDRFHFKAQTPDATGSAAATPCRLNSETFSVPSSSGGNRQVEVVSCR
jgi:hypothetical protein